MAVPVELSDRDSLVKSASTSLNSKVVSQYSTLLAPLAVDVVLSVVDNVKVDLVDLRDVKIVKKLGGTAAKILVVKDVERDAIEFITKTLNCFAIANIEHFREEKMGRL
ncbi:hypothetical protein IFM89_027783 [Coptis chinensis]|uniref:Uncharacterized protein n=1 Tax=Coptis chinensis TaxID=261450 RepID=A0A835I8I8_9MAGN|nr:hypothetical protein IFM89_027783 [Coptis chinensis]